MSRTWRVTGTAAMPVGGNAFHAAEGRRCRGAQAPWEDLQVPLIYSAVQCRRGCYRVKPCGPVCPIESRRWRCRGETGRAESADPAA